MRQSLLPRLLSLLLLAAVAFAAPAPVLFDSGEDITAWDLYLGPEFPGATGAIASDPKGKTTLEGDFSQGGAYVSAIFHRPVPSGVRRLEITVTALVPGNGAIRIRDANGVFFQTTTVALPAGKPTVLSARLDTDDWFAKWGGENPGAATPRHPLGQILLNAMPEHGKTAARVRIDAVRIVGPDVALVGEVTPRHPLNLILPDQFEAPRLRLLNVGAEPLELEGAIILKNWDDTTYSLPCKTSIAPGQDASFALPLGRDKQGVWRVAHELLDKRSGRTLVGESRIGVMTPAGSTREKARGFLFGISSHPYNHPPAIRELEALATALCGAKVLRTDACWGSHIQPTPDKWDFSWLDQTVAANAKHGIELQLLLGYAPRWSWSPDWKPIATHSGADLSGHQTLDMANWAGRPDYEHWRRFVIRTAERYKDRIRLYEVWNEPDLELFANFSVNEYIQMQKIAFQEIKKRDAGAKVLNGGIAWSGPDRAGPKRGIIGRILASGTNDIFAFHGHGTLTHYKSEIAYIKRQLAADPLPWYANETAISAVLSGEAGQARTLFQKFIYTWAEGGIGYNWYDLRNDGFDPANGEHNFGLLTYDFKPKAAYLAYNTLATHFRDGAFKAEVAAPENIRVYRFESSDGDTLLTFWCEAPEIAERLLLLGDIDGQAELIDLMGNRSPLPVHNGELQFKVTPTPSILRLAGRTRTPRILGEPLIRGEAITISPGGRHDIELGLANPSVSPRTIRLSAIAPVGIEAGISVEHRLNPGEKRALRLPVRADDAFTSYAAEPKHLALRLALEGFPPVELACPLLTEIHIPRDKLPASPSFLLGHKDQVHPLITNEPTTAHLHWKGPQDLGAEIRLARRDGKLLLEARITDDIHVQKERGPDVWKGDNIQFALGLPGQKDFWEIGLTRLDDGAAEVFVWRAPAGFEAAKTAAAIRLLTWRDEALKLTRYEAAIPLSVIGLTEKSGRAGFRFNLIINDNDGPQRESFIRIAPGLGEDKDPAKYPVVRFQ